MKLRCTSLLLLGSCTALLAATDWPMYRGDAALTGIAKSTVPDKPALLWSFKTGAAVRSSPVICNGKVFVGSDDSNVYALDFKTGTKVWEFKTDGPVQAAP